MSDSYVKLSNSLRRTGSPLSAGRFLPQWLPVVPSRVAVHRPSEVVF